MTAPSPPRQATATSSRTTETSFSTRTFLSWLWGLALLDSLVATRSTWLALALILPILILSGFLAKSASGVRSSLVGQYRYSGPVRRDPAILRVMAIGLAASALAVPVLGGSSGFVGLVASLVTFYQAICDNTIVIARRFVAVNDRMLFFDDIEKIVLQGITRSMELHGKSGSVLRIEQDQFPTKARKPNKIAANREAKMGKVSALILKQLGRYPHVRIFGSLNPTGTPTT